MDDLGQKIKGKVNQIKGELEQHSDDPVDKLKGSYDKAKGKLQEETAERQSHTTPVDVGVDLDDEE